MIKAYADHPSDNVHNVYDAAHLQESAAEWFKLMQTCDYPRHMEDTDGELREAYNMDYTTRARKYARARYAMGLREADYNFG